MFFIKYSFVIYGELLSKLMNCTGVIVARSKCYAPIFIAHSVSTEEIFALFLFHLCDNCKYIFWSLWKEMISRSFIMFSAGRLWLVFTKGGGGGAKPFQLNFLIRKTFLQMFKPDRQINLHSQSLGSVLGPSEFKLWISSEVVLKVHFVKRIALIGILTCHLAEANILTTNFLCCDG